MKIKFKEISLTGYKIKKCLICGKRVKKQKKFYQTLNPYNRNKFKEIKTEKEIISELQEKIKIWKNILEICNKCKI